MVVVGVVTDEGTSIGASLASDELVDEADSNLLNCLLIVAVALVVLGVAKSTLSVAVVVLAAVETGAAVDESD